MFTYRLCFILSHLLGKLRELICLQYPSHPSICLTQEKSARLTKQLSSCSQQNSSETDPSSFSALNDASPKTAGPATLDH